MLNRKRVVRVELPHALVYSRLFSFEGSLPRLDCHVRRCFRRIVSSRETLLLSVLGRSGWSGLMRSPVLPP